MALFIDTCAILASLKAAEPHHAWSIAAIAKAKEDGPVVVTDIVFGELSAGVVAIKDVDEILADLALERLRPSREALFQAGNAFKRYKGENKGVKLNVLSDFLIGAHAVVDGDGLITTNPDDFRTYFASLNLIVP